MDFKRITVKDIAQSLGISIGTVDRAIHNRKGINEEVRSKVLEKAEELGYKPNKFASLLTMKTCKKIGLIYPLMPSFFWSNVEGGFRAAENELHEFPMQVIHCQINGYLSINENKILEYMDALIKQQVDAIALIPINTPDVKAKIMEAKNLGILVSTFNDDIDNMEDRDFFVGPCLERTGRLAAELMGKLLRGKGNIIVISGMISSLSYQKRLDCFKEVIFEKYNGINILSYYFYDLTKPIPYIQEVIKSMIINNPLIDAIYDLDGSTLNAVGKVINEVDKSGRIVLIGHEFSEDARGMLMDDTISAVINQDPFSQGYYTLKIINNYLFGVGEFKRVFEFHTKLDIILKENVSNLDHYVF